MKRSSSRDSTTTSLRTRSRTSMVKRSLFATSGARERRYGPDVPSPWNSSRP